MTPAHEDARAAAPNAKAMIEHIARAMVDAPSPRARRSVQRSGRNLLELEVRTHRRG